MSEDGERLPRGIPYGWIIHNNKLKKLYVSHIIRDINGFGDVIDRYVCNVEDKPVEENEILWHWPHISVPVDCMLSPDSDIITKLGYGDTVRKDNPDS